MPIPHYTTTCLSNEKIATEIFEFRLQKPKGFTFEPGQFVLFDVPLLDNPDDIQTRAFSIASSPSEEDLLFVAKILPGGRASVWIESALEEGMPVRMQGPFGRFVLHEPEKHDMVFICTSTGIAPFRSQFIDAIEKGVESRIDIIFGTRTDDRLFWKEELMKLADMRSNFFIHFVLTDEEEHWQEGHHGRVQDVMPDIITDIPSKKVYVCGHPDMTADVKKLCLEEWGVLKENVHVEGYI